MFLIGRWICILENIHPLASIRTKNFVSNANPFRLSDQTLHIPLLNSLVSSDWTPKATCVRLPSLDKKAEILQTMTNTKQYLIWKYTCSKIKSKSKCSSSLQWRHNELDGVSNHRLDCLLNRLFRRRSKKTSKLRVTGLCRGIHRWPVNLPHKGSVTRKMYLFDNVITTLYYM